MSEKIFVNPLIELDIYLKFQKIIEHMTNGWIEQKEIAQKLYNLNSSLEIGEKGSKSAKEELEKKYKELLKELDPKNKALF